MSTLSNDFTIRPASIEDGQAIASMLDEFRAYLRALGDMNAIVSFGVEEFQRDGFGGNRAFHTLIAERGNQALGYAIYGFGYSTDTGKRDVFLHDLFVRSGYRGQGIGESLFKSVLEICRDHGGASVDWLVWHANESAIRFYERMGARRVRNIELMRIHVG